MPSIVGVTLAKINNIFRVDVTNAAWNAARSVTEFTTGSGIQLASCVIPRVSGGFDEVVPISGMFDWASLSNFSIQIYDQATQNLCLLSATGCEWFDIGGSSNVSQASTGRKIGWRGRLLQMV